MSQTDKIPSDVGENSTNSAAVASADLSTSSPSDSVLAEKDLDNAVTRPPVHDSPVDIGEVLKRLTAGETFSDEEIRDCILISEPMAIMQIKFLKSQLDMMFMQASNREALCNRRIVFHSDSLMCSLLSNACKYIFVTFKQLLKHR